MKYTFSFLQSRYEILYFEILSMSVWTPDTNSFGWNQLQLLTC